MAKVHPRWYGFDVEMTRSDIVSLSKVLNTSGASFSALAATLAHIPGIGDSAVVNAALMGALLQLGIVALDNCDTNRRGIVLVVLWVGLPYCKPLP
jgi:hypothetical protein